MVVVSAFSKYTRPRNLTFTIARVLDDNTKIFGYTDISRFVQKQTVFALTKIINKNFQNMWGPTLVLSLYDILFDVNKRWMLPLNQQKPS